jgi:hypothetical protein
VEGVDGTACGAFLAIWHDIAPGHESEFERWHTEEHMPERLSLPRFARGRRGLARGPVRQRYVTLYEGAELGTFDSPEYRERLDHPTPWSTRVLPSFRDFARVACETVASAGTGVGGATATLRLTLDDAAGQALRGRAPETAGRLIELDGVSSVLVGLVRTDVAAAPTTETGLRESVDPERIDAVVVLDGIGVEHLEAAIPAARGVVEAADPGITATRDGVYALSFLLCDRRPPGPEGARP